MNIIELSKRMASWQSAVKTLRWKYRYTNTGVLHVHITSLSVHVKQGGDCAIQFNSKIKA